MCQSTWPTCVLVCIQRQQTSRQFVTVTSKDFVLASGVLPICIYVKRPKTSHHSRVTFVFLWSLAFPFWILFYNSPFLFLYLRLEAEALSLLAFTIFVITLPKLQDTPFLSLRDPLITCVLPFLWLFRVLYSYESCQNQTTPSFLELENIVRENRPRVLFS